MRLLIFIQLVLFLSCSSFQHRSFEDEMERTNSAFFVPGRDFEVVAGDAGYKYEKQQNELMERTPLTRYEREQEEYKHSIREELRFLEGKLSLKEQQIYMTYRNSLRNASEKIYYLLLTPPERREFLRAKVGENYTPIDRNIGKFKYSRRSLGSIQLGNDLEVGMSKDDVLSSWGKPEFIDISGSLSSENERWTYRKESEIKYVFFESGIVDSWIID